MLRPASLGLGIVAVGLGAVAVQQMRRGETKSSAVQPFQTKNHLRSLSTPRETILERLRNSPCSPFDVLVIGAGATGAGVALDAVTRRVYDASGAQLNKPLKVALVDRDDVSSGTSSRSTKLLHGGVRYLEQAVFGLDPGKLALVTEALRERGYLLRVAPHLSRELPILVPAYKWWEIPFYFSGLALYDIISGKESLGMSTILSASSVLQVFPQVNRDGLKGGIVYYDGQHDDARMNLSIAMSAADHGATVATRLAVQSLIKDDTGKVIGANCVDVDGDPQGKAPFPVYAKCIVNATGPFCDGIRLMEDANAEKIIVPSLGGHLVLPGAYSPQGMGLLVPKTSDGRVLFLLPWLGRTVVGTTDNQSDVVDLPALPGEGADFIMLEAKRYLSDEMDVANDKILSTWAGVRPLVRLPGGGDKSTAQLSRSHSVLVGAGGVVTIAGGKWTTYRSMAQDTVDHCIAVNDGLSPTAALKASSSVVKKHLKAAGGNGASKKVVGESRTLSIPLAGGEGWHKGLPFVLRSRFCLDEDVAVHLSSTYGTRAFDVVDMITNESDGDKAGMERMSPHFPYLMGEVTYAVRAEGALSAVDVLGRRTRLAFLDHGAAVASAEPVIQRMKKLLGWSSDRVAREREETAKYLKSFATPADKK